MSNFRSGRWQRASAWMGVIAVLLLACAPTISRVARLHAAAVQCSEHAAHAHHGGAETANPAKAGDGCSSPCGYCDFLSHSPALAGVEYIAQFEPPSRPSDQPAYARIHLTAWFVAALPRGPPFSLV